MTLRLFRLQSRHQKRRLWGRVEHLESDFVSREASEAWRLAVAAAEHYNLGRVRSSRFVPGGLLNRLIRVETEGGVWALKLLNLDGGQKQPAHFERSEEVAARASAAGIPALTATPGRDGAFVQRVAQEHVILYAWCEGRILSPHAVTTSVALQMGGLLARIHNLEIRFPNQNPPEPEAFEVGHWEALANIGKETGASWAPAVNDALPRLVQANAQAKNAQLALRAGWVTGHLDYDQKNVLWDDAGQPTIIDWEAAKPIHPALEAVGAGLSWAGQSAGATNEDVFKAFLHGYQALRPLETRDLERACDGVLGKWLIWLEYNLRFSLQLDSQLKRASGHQEENRSNNDALFHALGATLKLQDDVTDYRAWVKG